MNNKIKVLIGDDSAGTGVSLANKLREKGMYAYTRRKDCSVIVDSIRNDPPDAAVLDITAENGDAVTIMKKVSGSPGIFASASSKPLHIPSSAP